MPALAGDIQGETTGVAKVVMFGYPVLEDTVV